MKQSVAILKCFNWNFNTTLYSQWYFFEYISELIYLKIKQMFIDLLEKPDEGEKKKVVSFYVEADLFWGQHANIRKRKKSNGNLKWKWCVFLFWRRPILSSTCKNEEEEKIKGKFGSFPYTYRYSVFPRKASHSGQIRGNIFSHVI